MENIKKDQVTHNAVKLVGEAIMPGASLLMDGKILEGGAHLVVGTAARMLLGPLGLALVIANSYSKSTTGKGLLKQFSKDEPASHPATASHPAVTPAPAPSVIVAPTSSKP